MEVVVRRLLLPLNISALQLDWITHFLDQLLIELIIERKNMSDHDEHPMPSAQKEEETIKKKYGGIVPKKPPLISKDHERAYFDSADWALGKGGQKPKGPLEALRPKLQPTPHQQVRSRRASYARADDVEDGVNTSEENSPSGLADGGSSTNTMTEDQSRHE